MARPPASRGHGQALHTALALVLGAGPVAAVVLRDDPAYDMYYAHCTDADVRDKDYDLVIYGATGFVGQLAVEYLSQGHPNMPRWAIAGRDRHKLVDLFYKHRPAILGGNDQNVSRLASESIAVAMHDLVGLNRMAKRAKTILNFASPYEQIGTEELIRAAVTGCAHYVDVSGETQWKSYIVKKFHVFAAKRGTAIVQSAGFYSMASDLLAMTATKELERKRLTPTAVQVVWTTLSDHATGGQLQEETARMAKYGPILDPYALVPGASEWGDTTPDGFATDQRRGPVYGYDSALRMTLLHFAGAKMDCCVVRRSMATEYRSFPVAVRAARNLSIDEDALRASLQPKLQTPVPGEGAPEWVRKMGSARAFAVGYSDAAGSDPASMTTLEVHGDPSTVATPRMAVEFALMLSKDAPPRGRAGYLTTATAVQVPKLIKRLHSIGGHTFMRMTRQDAGKYFNSFSPSPFGR